MADSAVGLGQTRHGRAFPLDDPSEPCPSASGMIRSRHGLRCSQKAVKPKAPPWQVPPSSRSPYSSTRWNGHHLDQLAASWPCAPGSRGAWRPHRAPTSGCCSRGGGSSTSLKGVIDHLLLGVHHRRDDLDLGSSAWRAAGGDRRRARASPGGWCGRLRSRRRHAASGLSQ